MGASGVTKVLEPSDALAWLPWPGDQPSPAVPPLLTSRCSLNQYHSGFRCGVEWGCRPPRQMDDDATVAQVDEGVAPEADQRGCGCCGPQGARRAVRARSRRVTRVQPDLACR
jgi:hypothetical protein